MPTVAINSHPLEIPCPHCAPKLGKTIGQLKTLNTLACPSCRSSFVVDKSKTTAEIAKVEREVKAHVDKAQADLRKALSRLGK